MSYRFSARTPADGSFAEPRKRLNWLELQEKLRRTRQRRPQLRCFIVGPRSSPCSDPRNQVLVQTSLSLGSPLERELEGELHQTWVVQGRVHRAEPRGTDVVHRHTEMRVIEE